MDWEHVYISNQKINNGEGMEDVYVSNQKWIVHGEGLEYVACKQ